MGRGRFGVGKIVPPKGWRWAPKPNAFARCVGNQLMGQTGGGRGGVRNRFLSAVSSCRGTRGS